MKPTNIWQVSLAASAALLFVAVFGTWPYGFYQLLRWIVSITSAYTAYQLWLRGNHIWASVFILLGILFNSIAPIHFNKNMWQSIDFIAGLFLVVGYFKIRRLTV
ncbi:MAG: hypothetical protein A2020_00890 [Lentisphaerae bacterium GWF2_45_14]|nr:MAG: hypothetical protein A2020_00890 [Lentisphaerae bacterium GWF2_45_14]HIG93335.1 hypothetical protein [Candidatus Woesearchaeota archaeon]